MQIPRRPTSVRELFARLGPELDVQKILAASPTSGDGQYRHWDTMRRIKPPAGHDSETWWLATKLARIPLQKRLPLLDAIGQPFTYCLPDPALQMLHTIDQRAAGEIAAREVVTNPASRDRYIVSSLIEEAITSSQLEGAATTRVVAKEMLRTGRPPRDRSERMILNNFRAIQFVREHRDDPLTPDLVVRVQEIVTHGTLDDPDHAGRIQTGDDDRARVEDSDGSIVHQPPPAHELPERMALMCSFANGGGTEGFMHPIARAIFLHLWLAYDHPFADGNGRTARALFYWSMLRQGYWLAEFLSISRIIKEAPARYARSFLYTETDDNDATYFLLSQLKIIGRAIDDFYEYLARKVDEVRDLERMVRASAGLNHRQIALLSHALRHPGGRYTFASHGRSHGVVHQTARTDLLRLRDLGLLEQRKLGRAFAFVAVTDLAARLEALDS